MAQLLRLLFLALIIASAMWGIAIWYWRDTAADIETQDLFVYLLVLPATALGMALLLRSAWHRAGAMPAAAARTETAQAPTQQEHLPAERRFIQVLAQGVVCSGADEIQAALKLLPSPPPPEPDPELADLEGMNVFTRRFSGIQGDGFEREAAMIERCVAPVLQHLSALSEAVQAARPEEPVPQPMHPTLVVRRKPPPPPPRVRVLWGAAHSRDRDGVERHAQEAVSRWAAQVPGYEWQLELQMVESGVALLAAAERQLSLGRQTAMEELLLVLAAASLVDERIVAELEAGHRLFSARHADGFMLGEAAATLLLAASPSNDLALESVQAPCSMTMHWLIGKADPEGKARSQCGALLSVVMADALTAAACEPEAVEQMISDTDAQRSVADEVLAATAAQLPHMRAHETSLFGGLATGHIGIAAPLVSIAMAAELAESRRTKVMAVAHMHPRDRMAALLMPAPQA